MKELAFVLISFVYSVSAVGQIIPKLIFGALPPEQRTNYIDLEKGELTKKGLSLLSLLASKDPSSQSVAASILGVSLSGNHTPYRYIQQKLVSGKKLSPGEITMGRIQVYLLTDLLKTIGEEVLKFRKDSLKDERLKNASNTKFNLTIEIFVRELLNLMSPLAPDHLYIVKFDIAEKLSEFVEKIGDVRKINETDLIDFLIQTVFHDVLMKVASRYGEQASQIVSKVALEYHKDLSGRANLSRKSPKSESFLHGLKNTSVKKMIKNLLICLGFK